MTENMQEGQRRRQGRRPQEIMILPEAEINQNN